MVKKTFDSAQSFEDIEFEDTDQRGSQDTKDFKQLILNHYKVCIDESSKEMTRSGVIRRIIDGQVFERAVPDQVEIFINSVKSLKAALTDLIKKEKELMQPKIEAYEEAIQKIEKERNDYVIKANDRKQYDPIYIRYHADEIRYKEQQAERIAAQRYDDALVNLHRKLLADFSELFGAINYFNEFGAKASKK